MRTSFDLIVLGTIVTPAPDSDRRHVHRLACPRALQAHVHRSVPGGPRGQFHCRWDRDLSRDGTLHRPNLRACGRRPARWETRGGGDRSLASQADICGAAHLTQSDQFLELEELPRRILPRHAPPHLCQSLVTLRYEERARWMRPHWGREPCRCSTRSRSCSATLARVYGHPAAAGGKRVLVDRV